MSITMQLLLTFLALWLRPASSLLAFRTSRHCWTSTPSCGTTTTTVLFHSSNDWKTVNEEAAERIGDATSDLADEMIAMAKASSKSTDWQTMHSSAMDSAGSSASDFADELLDLAERCQDNLEDVQCDLFRNEVSGDEKAVAGAVKDLREVSSKLRDELAEWEEECRLNPTAEKCAMSFMDSELSVEVSEYKGVKLQ